MAIASKVVKKKAKAVDTTALEGLAAYAKSVGMKKEAEKALKKPKLSVLQRLGRGFSAFEPGNAIYQQRYEKASFLPTYVGDIYKELKTAFTGRESRETAKMTFKNIMVKEGAKDRPGKIDTVDVAGLAADILTDPTTWFGGFVGKGIAKGTGKAIKVAEKIPGIGKGVTATKDALGGLFRPGYKLQKTEAGKKVWDEYIKYVKGTRAATVDFENELVKRAKSVGKTKEQIAEAGMKIGKRVETPLDDISKAKASGQSFDEWVKGQKGYIGKDRLTGKDFNMVDEISKKPKFQKTEDVDFNKYSEEYYRDFDKKLKPQLLESAKKTFDSKDVKVIDVDMSGSYKRGTPNPESDLDVKVYYEGKVSEDVLAEKMETLWSSYGVHDVHIQKVQTRSQLKAEWDKSLEKTGDIFDDVADYFTNFFTKEKYSGKELVERGIIKRELPNWMHHALTPEAQAYLNAGGEFLGFGTTKVPKFYHRSIKATASEINQEFAKKHGFNLFEEDAFKAFHKAGLKNIKAIETYDFIGRIGNQFAKTFNQLDEADKTMKWVAPSEKIRKIIGDKLLPEDIVKHLDEVYSAVSSDEALNGFIKLYDNVLSFWKGSVTGWFPSFHTRNAIGGVFNNWIAGVKNPALYATADNVLRGKGIVKIGTQSMDAKALKQLAGEHGVLGQTGILDTAEFMQKKIAPGLGTKIKETPQRVMGVIEDRMRLTLFIDGLQKGLDPMKAAKRVIKYHFDYMPEGFTKFEKTIMRRVIPFYTWTRHNIPLQIEQMIMQPGKYAGVFKTSRSFGAEPTSEEESVLPRWLREQFVVKSEGGYWTGVGLPLEEASQKLSAPLRGFGISMSPLIKVPIEQLTGYNIFKERRIDEDTYGRFYKNVPSPIKEYLQLQESTSKEGKKYYTVNPRRLYWLEVFGSRGLNTGVRLLNAVKDDDAKQGMNLLTTIKKYDYNIDDLKEWADKDAMEQLEKELMRAGKLREFKRTYVPKTD